MNYRCGLLAGLITAVTLASTPTIFAQEQGEPEIEEIHVWGRSLQQQPRQLRWLTRQHQN